MQDFINWLAIVIGIVAITLAVVAIWFAVSVDRRARQQQADLTLRSLLRVQAAVETQVGDTQNLLRAGWERMAGNPATAPPPAEQTRALAIADEQRPEQAVAPDPAAGVTDEPAEPAAVPPTAPTAAAPRMPVQYDRSRSEQSTPAAPATNGSTDPLGSEQE